MKARRSRRTGSRLGIGLIALACSLWPAAAAAQTQESGSLRIEVGVDPDHVTVGDRFRSFLRIVPPPGYRIEYGEFASTDSLQATAPVTSTPTAAGGTAAVYPLVAWVAAMPVSASVAVRVIAPDGSERTQQVALRLPEVASVIPADADPVTPMPPKGLFVPPLRTGIPWWWWLLLVLGALAVGLVAFRLLRHPDGRVEPPVDPREWALAQLSGAASLLASGDLEALVDRVAWIARAYLWRVRTDLGPDLTTTEVVERMMAPSGTDADAASAATLAEILRVADRVKFARHRPDPAEAKALLLAGTAWIESYPPPVGPADADRRAA